LGLGVAEIPFVVDINPHKTGTFLAGSGQEIVAPPYLSANPPDVVIIMNPIYRAEIGRDLQAMGLNPILMTVEDI
nr:SAM-dependent methyltransferase [Chloroflexota bacterium]